MIAANMLQYVVPLLIACILGVAGVAEIETYEDAWVVRTTISLPGVLLWTAATYGGFVFVLDSDTYSHLDAYLVLDNWMLQHEYGHVLQQRILSVGYLPLIAIPSLSSSIFFPEIHYRMPWEQWANQLSGYDSSRLDFLLWKMAREQFLNIRNVKEKLTDEELYRLFRSSQRAY